MKKLYSLALRLAFVSLFSVLLSSCAPFLNQSTPTAYPGLGNKGILALSTNDPERIANRFLAKQIEDSATLWNFFEARGGPSAIELIENQSGVLRVLFYYPGARKVYASDQVFRQNWASPRWIIHGPFPIGDEDFQKIVRQGISMHGVPVLTLHGSSYRFRA